MNKDSWESYHWMLMILETISVIIVHGGLCAWIFIVLAHFNMLFPNVCSLKNEGRGGIHVGRWRCQFYAVVVIKIYLNILFSYLTFIQFWIVNKMKKLPIQISVIYSRENGSQTPQDQLIPMRAVFLSNLLKIVWKMGDQIQVIYIGDGSHMVAKFLSLMQRNFWMSWRINPGQWLVIPFFATMFSHWFAFLLRYNSDISVESFYLTLAYIHYSSKYS